MQIIENKPQFSDKIKQGTPCKITHKSGYSYLGENKEIKYGLVLEIHPLSLKIVCSDLEGGYDVFDIYMKDILDDKVEVILLEV